MSLPDDLAATLTQLRPTRSPEFYSTVLAIHNAGWTFQAIGTAVGVSRSAVNQWHKIAIKKSIPPADIVVVPPDKILSGTPRKIRPDIPKKDRIRLLKVSALARKNRRWSAPRSPERKAANELNNLIQLYVVERKVPVSTFARRAGVSNRAITQRLERM